MHGGKSPGASKGNRNAMKHSGYTAASIQQKRDLRNIVREARRLMGLLREQEK
jgi:hypothetical protein